MTKRLLHCGLLSLGFLLLGKEEGFSQSGTQSGIELKEVEIKARVVRKSTGESAQELKSLPPEILQTFAPQVYSGFDLRERGGFGVQEDLSLRGATFEQNLVLFEGMRISDPQTGHHLLNLPLGVEDLSGLEIMPGGLSPFYGPGGFGGALNFKLDESRPGLEVTAGAGSYDLREWSLKAGLPLTLKSSFNFGLFQKKAEGFIENRDFDLRGFNFYTKDKEKTVFYGFIEKDFGARNFYTPRFDSEWEETKTHLFLLKRNLVVDGVLLEPALLVRRNYDYYVLKRENPDFYKNRHVSEVYRLKLPLTFELGKTLFNLGLEGGYETLDSTRLGEYLRRSLSLFGKVSPRITERLSGALMVRYDSYVGEKDLLSLGCGLSHTLTDKLRFRLSVNHSYRLPSLTELRYESLGIRGNPELSAERALNLEGGLDLKFKKLEGSLSLFYRRGWDLIDWAYDEALKKTIARNVNLKTIGTTLDGRYTLSALQILFSYTYLRSFGADLRFSQYFGNYLKHNVYVGVKTKLPQGFGLSLGINHQKRNWQEGVNILDVSVDKSLGKKVNLSLWGKNLLDESYYEVYYPYAKKGVLATPQWLGVRVTGRF